MTYLERLPGTIEMRETPSGDPQPVCVYSPHSLRATTATLLLDSGVPIESVQDLLDHKHITITQITIKRGRASGRQLHIKCRFSCLADDSPLHEQESLTRSALVVRFSYYIGKTARIGGMMTQMEIEKIIIETLYELQAGSQEPECAISANTSPLVDLAFFDSLLAIETTIALETKLGCSCGEGSIFKHKVTSEGLTISQVAAKLGQLSKVMA